MVDRSLDGKSDKDSQSRKASESKSVLLGISDCRGTVQAVIESAKRREMEEEEALATRHGNIEGDDAGGDAGADHEDACSSQEGFESTHQMILAELLTQVRSYLVLCTFIGDPALIS